MERPFDLDNFYKEQDDRMNASESDWEEYEERRHLERKRKRESRRSENAAATAITEESASLFPPSLSQIRRETDAALKRRKVIKGKIESIELAKESETLQDNQEQQVVSVEVPETLISSVAASKPRTVSLRREPTRSVPKPTPPIPPQDLSNITTPSSTTASIPPFKQQQKSPNTAAAPVIKKRPMAATVSEPKASTSTGPRLVKTISGSALNRRRNTKKPPEDKEYAAILHEKWQGKVSSTPPEQLFLKDCMIFMVFEEKNKSTKDTRIKLDLIARNGGQVATSYEPANITHIIPGRSTITKKKILRALGLKSVDDIPPHIHTVNWDWIVSRPTHNRRASEIMYELWKERLLIYAGVRVSNNRSNSGANSKGKGKEVETNNPPAEEFSVIEDFSVDSSLGKRDKKPVSPQEDLNTSATSSKVSINN